MAKRYARPGTGTQRIWTNWEMLPETIDQNRTDWARTQHKRTVYAQEMRDQWHANQCRKDEQTLLMRDLDMLAEMI